MTFNFDTKTKKKMAGTLSSARNLVKNSVRNRKKLLFFAGIIMILLPVAYVTFLKPKSSEAAWWNDNWTYRRSVPVTNNTGAETNVYINFTGSSTIDTSDTVKFQGDCGDLRFTDYGGAPLKHYIDSGCSTANTVVHVFFESFNSGPQDIYYYYGNPSVANGQEGSDFSTEATNYTIGAQQAEEISPGPIAYWKLDEGYGTTANDSIKGNDGTVSGAIWEAEMCTSDKCLSMDGENDTVSVSDNSALDFAASDDFTVEVWIRSPTMGGGIQNVLSKFEPEGGDGGYKLYLSNSGDVGFGIDDDNASFPEDSTVSSTSDYDDSRWHHIAGVKDGTTSIKLYIDGELIDTDDTISATESLANNDDFYLGVQSDGTTDYFDGYIDEVKLYPYVRSDDEIKQDYLGKTPSGAGVVLGLQDQGRLASGLIGYYKMDEDGGGIDSSGNNTGLTDYSSTQTSGRFDRGRELPGSSSKHFLKSSSKLSGTQTMSFWVNPDSNTNYYMTMNQAELSSSSGTISTSGLSNPRIYVNGKESNTIAANSWQHVTVTTDTPINDAGSVSKGTSANVGDAGKYSSIYCVSANDCKMAYYDSTEGALKFMDCDDATCTSGTINTLDGASGCTLTGGDDCSSYPTDTDDTGQYPSLDCSNGSDDCKIAYRNGFFDKSALFFADCDDATCSTGSMQMLDGDNTVTCALTGGDDCDTYPTDTDDTGQYPSLDCSAGATDCKIAYYNANEDALFFADCDDATCSTGSMQMLDGDDTITCALTGGDDCDTYPTDTDQAGWQPSLDCSAGATDCKVVYRNSSEGALFFGDCDDATCSTGSLQMLDGDTTVTCALTGGDDCNTYTDLDSTGYDPFLDCSAGSTDCKVAYLNLSEGALFFGDCDDATCSTGSMQMLDGDNTVTCALSGGEGCQIDSNLATNYYKSLTLYCPSATDCKLSYYNSTSTSLVFGDCDNATCSSGSVQNIDGYNNNVGLYSSVYCVSANDCKMAYYDSTEGALKFMDCDDATCTSGTINTLDGASGCTLTGGDDCSSYPTDTDDTGQYPSLDCSNGSDDCKIAYVNLSEGALFFADCDDETCSTGSMQMLDGDTTVTCALTGGDDCDTYPTDTDTTGFPSLDCSNGSDDCKIAYLNSNEGALFFADCGDAACSTGSMQMLDGDTTVTCALTGGDDCDTYPTDTDNTGQYPSLDCSAGTTDCKIAYYNSTEDALFFADCGDATCSTGSMQMLDGDTTVTCALTGGDDCDTYPTDTDNTGYRPYLDCSAGATDCKIVYHNYTEGALFFADCGDAACSTGSMQMLDGDDTVTCALTGGDDCDTYPTDTDDAGDFASLDCSAGATDCKVVYYNETEDALFFADCDDAACSTGSMQMLDGDDTVVCSLSSGDGCESDIDAGYTLSDNISLYCPSATDCKISYYDRDYNSLHFGDCSDATCSSGSTYIADNGLPTTLQLGKVGSNYLDGTIDEVRLYNRVISTSEIEALYNWAPGPIGYWKMDEGSLNNDCSTDTVFDSSGNGNHGVSCPASTGSTGGSIGKFGKAIEFDGSEDYVELDGAKGEILAGNAITLSAWINPDDSDEYTAYPMFNQYGRIISRRTNSDGENNYALSVNFDGGDSKFGIMFWDSSIDSTNTLQYGKWQHIAGTYDGSGVWSVFVDGVLEGSRSDYFPTEGALTFPTYYIGSETSTVLRFNGLLDEVKVYDYARTQEQIIEDMNAGHPVPGSPIGSAKAHWKFDEGYGDTAYDSMGSYHGDLAGSGETCPGAADCPTRTNSGKFSRALEFDGTYDYVSSSLVSDSTDDMSLSVWLNWRGPDGGNQAIFFNGSETSGNGWYVYVDNSVSDYLSVICHNVNTTNSDTTLTSDTWQHVFVQRNSGTWEIYLDGKELTMSGATTCTPNTPTTETVIGKPGPIQNYSFNGKIDEVKYFDFTLTPSQINTLYAGGASQVLGAISTDGTGPASWAASAEYCPPGDSATCSPPVAEWAFDEKAGTSAYDTSENNNTGAITNAEWQHAGKCKEGACLYFDGTGTAQYINAGSDPSITNLSDDAFTVEAWIKADGYGISNAGYFFRKDDGGAGFGLGFTTGSSSGLHSRVGCATTDAQSNAGLDEFSADSQWHHVAMTFDDAGDRYIYQYIDGRPVASYSSHIQCIDAVEADSNNDLYLGNGGEDSSYEFEGNIDEIRIFDYVRTPAQIAWSYNKGGPVGWWKFDECSGTTAYDSSGFGNNGTISIGNSGDLTSAGSCGGSSTEAWAGGETGKINASLEFDGNDDYVLIGDPAELDFDGSHSFTVAAWVMLDTENWSRAVSKFDNGGANDSSWMLSYSPGNDRLEMQISTTGADAASKACQETGTFEPDTWYHVVGWYDYDNLDVGCHLNGISNGTTNLSAQMHQGDIPIRIGTEDLDDSYWNGQIDEVKIWNYLLTDEQVKQDYNSGAARFN